MHLSERSSPCVRNVRLDSVFNVDVIAVLRVIYLAQPEQPSFVRKISHEFYSRIWRKAVDVLVVNVKQVSSIVEDLPGASFVAPA